MCNLAHNLPLTEQIRRWGGYVFYKNHHLVIYFSVYLFRTNQYSTMVYIRGYSLVWRIKWKFFHEWYRVFYINTSVKLEWKYSKILFEWIKFHIQLQKHLIFHLLDFLKFLNNFLLKPRHCIQYMRCHRDRFKRTLLIFLVWR